MQAVVVSLICAVIHFILEMLSMYIDARTSDSFFTDYLVACYNARQGWLPQAHDLNDNDLDKEGKPKTIEFDNKQKDLCKLGFSI